jgi:predicted AlkP superfamily phosphohydrolase/phosphomutase
MIAIFQFDAVGLPFLQEHIAEGRLPTVAKLGELGSWRTLTTPATYFEGAAAHSLYTGKDIGEHGLYYPFQWSAAEQRVRYTRDFPMPEAIWERIARAGRRSLIIDPYESSPPQTVAGLCLSGWQFTNRIVLRRWSVPHWAHRKFARKFGRPKSADEVYGRPSASELFRLYRNVLAGPDRAADVAIDLLARETFDLVWVTFSASHLAGHRFFDLSKLPAVEFDIHQREKFATALTEVCAAVDRALGRILVALPADADVIVLSPWGMTSNYSRSPLLPGMLHAVLSNGHSTTARSSRSAARSPLWRVRDSVPTNIRAGIARLLPDRLAIELTARMELRGVDWTRTPAFMLPNDDSGYVRLNLRGRERDGIVAPAEADALMDTIAAGLFTFRDPDGRPSVQSVDRTPNLVGRGVGSHQLPDLVISWTDRVPRLPTGVSSPLYGDVASVGSGTGRTGGHTGDAWALILPKKSRIRTPTRKPHVIDIAATVCSLLAVDAERLAGEPLLEPL